MKHGLNNKISTHTK